MIEGTSLFASILSNCVKLTLLSFWLKWTHLINGLSRVLSSRIGRKGAHSRLIKFLNHELLLTLELLDLHYIDRELRILLMHLPIVTTPDTLRVDAILLGLLPRSLLLKPLDLSGRRQLLLPDLFLLPLKGGLSLGQHLLRLGNVHAASPLELLLRPRSVHRPLLASALGCSLLLDNGVLALFFESHSGERFFFFVADALLNCIPLLLGNGLFLLGLLNVSLQGINPVLKLLHVLPTLLHLLLLLEHESALHLRLVDDCAVELRVLLEAAVVPVVVLE